VHVNLQVVIDCADPHAQARFWAAALGMEVERHTEMIRRLLDERIATDADVMEDDGELVWRDAAACRDPNGRLPRLYLQRVPETKAAKNRVHLDLHVGPDRREAETARLVALGASRLYTGEQGPNTWVTMADPEGNEFCVA
jgi:hypothetical protein